METIYGRHPVEEMLMSNPRSISKIYIKKGVELKFSKWINEKARAHRIPVMEVDGRKLSELAEGSNDQGVVALVAGTKFLELDEWLTSIKDIKNPCCLLLDELEDPHNVGAILRSAAAFGVHGIIFGKHRQSPITGGVHKSAVGTVGKVPLIRVTNLNNAIDVLKDNRFWIAGLDASGDTELSKMDMDLSLCVIVGAEGEGIRAKTLERCDFKLNIPMENGVESLNASVSVALVMYEWKKSRK